MKAYIKIAVAAFLMGSTISCSNDLDEKVYSLVTEGTYNFTTEDFHPTVASVYSYFRFIGHDNYWGIRLTHQVGMMVVLIVCCIITNGHLSRIM